MRQNENDQAAVSRSLQELVQLPGVGPQTAHQLYHQYGITSLDELMTALTAGRLTRLPGFGIQRLHRLKRDTAVLQERQHALPIALCWPWALSIAAELENAPGVARVSVTGAARRLQVMCPRIELVVALTCAIDFYYWCEARGGIREQNWIDVPYRMADESVPLRLYPTTVPLFALRLLETTGDATHVGVIQGMLAQNGIQWTEQGLIDAAGQSIQVEEEAEIYAQVSLQNYPPEQREGRGILQSPAELVRRTDIRGDLHVHSRWSDGTQTIAEIAQTAEQMGYAYVAITDHSQSLTIAGGLTPEDLQKQRGEIEEVRQKTKVQILAGSEVDILADGSLDFPDEVLQQLDIVVASIHSAMHQSKAQITKRLLKAVQHPAVDIIGHMTGRKIGRRAGYEVDTAQVFAAAATADKIIELNANPNRLDIADERLREAVSFGLTIAIDTDAHHSQEFDNITYGIRMATRGWLKPTDVLNTLPYNQLVAKLHQQRSNL